jgi:uncharacterized repeat protein (TIGR01451 family)
MTINSSTPPVPEGFTTETDYGRVSYGVGPTTSDSNTITVSIYTNPNLKITKTVSSPAQYSESVGTGNGSTTTFNKILSNLPVQSGKLSVLVNGVQAGADSGTGVIIGNNLQNSTINYTTGALHLEFITAPGAGASITALYNTPAKPGDTLTYTVTVTNVGASNATNVLVTDPIPADTSYKAGTLVYDSSSKTDANDSSDNAYFDAMNNRVVFVINDGNSLNYQDLLPNQSHIIQYSVTIDSPLTNGTTTTTNTATTSAANTASKDATAIYTANAGLVLSLTKSAPSLVPYPLTTVNGNHVNQTVINVFSVQYFAAGDVIFLGGQAVTVVAVNPTLKQITVSSPVSPGNKNPVYGTIKYRYTYKNTGNADATNVVITDVLSSSPQLNYIQATPAPTSAPAVNANGTVTWNLGTVPAGTTGTIVLWTRPTGTGTYLNSGSMSSNELPSFSSNQTTTTVGGIELSKSTSTPNVTNTASGVQATYIISFTNELASAASGITVADTLPAGFTFVGGSSSYSGGTCQFAPINGSTTPTWTNCTTPYQGTTTITFRALIAATVGTGTYQNPVTATHATISVIPFDELATTAEDVTVTVPNDLRVTKSVQNLSSPCNPGSCQVVYQVTVTNVGTASENSIVVNDVLPATLTYVSSSTSNGSYNSSNGNWTLASALAPNTSATLGITATVNTFTSQIQNCASLTGSTPADTNSGNNTGCAAIIPTLVTLSDFRAYEDNGRVVVEWSTSSEYDTAGFYLYRLDRTTGEYIKINHKLLPALLTSPQGGTYSLIDTGVSPDDGNLTYLLVEMEGKGSRNVYGPFNVYVDGKSATGTLNPDMEGLVSDSTCSSGNCSRGQGKEASSEFTRSFDTSGNIYVTNIKTGKRQAVRTDTGADLFEGYIRRPHEMSAERKARLEKLGEQRKSIRVSPSSQVSTGSAIKIAISEKGLYYLDASEIGQLMGLSTTQAMSMIRLNQLAMSSQGNSVAYLPAQGNTGIFFYGEGIDSRYTTDNIYWVKKGRGQTMSTAAGRGPSPSGSGTLTEKLHVEQDKFLVPAITQDPNVDFFFWDVVERYDATCDYCSKEFTIPAIGVANVPGATAELTANLYGFSQTGSHPDHHAKIYMNGTLIGEDTWDGQQPKTITIEFDQSLLHEGDNTVKVEAVLDTAPYSQFYINSFDIEYQRLYQAVDNSLLCKGGGNPVVSVSGFTDQNILVLDVTDPQKPRRNTATTIDGAAGNYRVSFVPASPDAQYLTVSSSAAATSLNAWADSPSNLSSASNKADYLVIAPAQLADAANSLAGYRKSRSFDTMVVLLEDIMDEFNYGISSPEAIKSFLSYAYKKWRKYPHYVVLLGEGTYDYKNSLGKGDNLMPPMLAGTPLGVFPADNLFADIGGNHVPEMAIGRFPILTSGEFTPILNKIKAYEAGTNKRVLMVADNPDSGGDFIAHSEDIAAIVPPAYSIVRLYLTDPSQADILRNTLIGELNNGSMLMNYIGHAGIDRLSTEGLLRTSDLTSLTNGNVPTILTAMTCSVGQYGIPGYDSLSESLVIDNGGGAVAVWAPTGLSYNDLAKTLDEGFFESALGGRTTLGKAIVQAFQHYNSIGGPPFMMDIYNLQGDPALKLR